MRLDQERGVTDPRNADFALANLWKMRADVIACALGKQRRDQDGRKEIAFMPIRMRPQLDACRTLVLSAVLRGLTNHVSAAFS